MIRRDFLKNLAAAFGIAWTPFVKQPEVKAFPIASVEVDADSLIVCDDIATAFVPMSQGYRVGYRLVIVDNRRWVKFVCVDLRIGGGHVWVQVGEGGNDIGGRPLRVRNNSNRSLI